MPTIIDTVAARYRAGDGLNHYRFRAIRALYELGIAWTEHAVLAAISSHNHALLVWLVDKGADVTPFASTAIAVPNGTAMKYVHIMADHFVEAAQMDDIPLLRKIHRIYKQQCDLVSESHVAVPPIKVEIKPFLRMLKNEHDVGLDGFWWLLQRGFVRCSKAAREKINNRYKDYMHRER